jgi:hypothetical protein
MVHIFQNRKPMFVVAQIIVVGPFLTLTLYMECIQKCAFSGKLKGSSIQGKMQKSLFLLQQNYRSLRLLFLSATMQEMHPLHD